MSKKIIQAHVVRRFKTAEHIDGRPDGLKQCTPGEVLTGARKVACDSWESQGLVRLVEVEPPAPAKAAEPKSAPEAASTPAVVEAPEVPKADAPKATVKAKASEAKK